MTIATRSRYKYLEDHNFFTRLAALDEAPDHGLARRLEKDLCAAFLYSGKQCGQTRQYSHTPERSETQKCITLLNKLRKQHLHQVDYSDQIRTQYADIMGGYQFPTIYQFTKTKPTIIYDVCSP